MKIKKLTIILSVLVFLLIVTSIIYFYNLNYNEDKKNADDTYNINSFDSLMFEKKDIKYEENKTILVVNIKNSTNKDIYLDSFDVILKNGNNVEEGRLTGIVNDKIKKKSETEVSITTDYLYENVKNIEFREHEEVSATDVSESSVNEFFEKIENHKDESK